MDENQPSLAFLFPLPFFSVSHCGVPVMESLLLVGVRPLVWVDCRVNAVRVGEAMAGGRWHRASEVVRLTVCVGPFRVGEWVKVRVDV